ncbi:site-specific integrase [Streptomyces thermolineatus]|uniref:Site-specific integrase n=1 Tax=Streptomyces thermolineatus TaxID=44033 RepID=A0ABN3L624_9ACTN
MNLTYDVEIWSIRARKNRPKPYELRWRVGARPHSKSFRLKPQAEGRRSELMEALRRRERFDVDSGLPESEVRDLQSPTWFDHACAYAAMKWPRASAKHRASIADALATVTPKLVRDNRGAPDPRVLRDALYQWAFRFQATEDGELKPRREVEDAPEAIAQALDWVSKKSVRVRDLASPKVLRPALDALLVKMNGEAAAPNTVRRKYPVFTNALRYAVEQELLDALPVTRVDWKPPQTDEAVDFRYVPNRRQADVLLSAVDQQGRRGHHLRAFFACIYYAGMRPAEVADLKAVDCHLPGKGWGELVLSGSRPGIASGWTDSGKPYDERGLKRRARRTTRPVPVPPVLVTLLQDHLAEFGTAADGRVFRAARGGPVRSNEYCAIWDAARRKALSAAEEASPLTDVPYSLRHACISLWLHAGVSPTEAARRAGQSVEVLYRVYAKVLHGLQDRSNDLIDKVLEEEPPG